MAPEQVEGKEADARSDIWALGVVVQADGSGRGGTIPGTSQQDAPGSISPDGENLVYLRTSPDTAGDIYVVPLRGEPTPRPFVKTSAYEGGPQFSSDGRWIEPAPRGAQLARRAEATGSGAMRLVAGFAKPHEQHVLPAETQGGREV